MDEKGQRIWGWKIALYLFLAGTGVGFYVVGVGADFAAGDGGRTARLGVALGGPVVALSTLFLVWDLGKPFSFLRAAFRPQTSWISRGVFILTAFILVSVLHLGLWLWPWQLLRDAETARHALGVVGGTLGVLTMVYTGLLLGVVRAIPFWNTPALPVLFLLSGLSTGSMALVALLAIANLGGGSEAGHPEVLLAVDSLFIALEGVVVFFYLYVAWAMGEAGRASAEMLVRGCLAAPFWVLFVGGGLLVPIALELAQLAALPSLSASGQLLLALLVAAPGLSGGFFLRLAVLRAGVKQPLRAGGASFPVHGRLRLLP